MIANLRKKLEELNNYQFSDTEWEDFFKNAVANPNEHIVEKTRKIQEDNVQVLTRDDGSSKNITLIDKKNIHNNRLQVINQYAISTDNGAKHNNRYDVTVLVNGLPLVHIELKRRGVSIREAFNQINRYQRESFWAGHGLYEYIQIFVISMVLIQSIIPTAPDGMRKRNMRNGEQARRRPATVLSLPAFGRMQITGLFQT